MLLIKWLTKPVSLFLLALCVGLFIGEQQARKDVAIAFQKAIEKSIKGYKHHISSAGAPSCHFYPSCSIYTREAIEKHGLVKGLLMGFDRLTRCHKDTEHYPTVWVKEQIKNLDLPDCY